MIVYRDVSKTYPGGGGRAVDRLSLTVEDGETLILLGPSGCGKTTLLKLTNQLETLSGGSIEVGQDAISDLDAVSLRRRIGYAFQGIGLFPHLTVAENIEMVPRLLGWSPARRQDRVAELLSLVELDPDQYADRFPDALSGGQAQRVGVARALAADPDYLLMDEPFGALDPGTRSALQDEMLRIKRQLQKTIVFVTHDIFEALILGDRIAVMNQGRLEQVGTKEDLIGNPASDYVRGLFDGPRQQLSRFHALLEQGGDDG